MVDAEDSKSSSSGSAGSSPAWGTNLKYKDPSSDGSFIL